MFLFELDFLESFEIGTIFGMFDVRPCFKSSVLSRGGCVRGNGV